MAFLTKCIRATRVLNSGDQKDCLTRREIYAGLGWVERIAITLDQVANNQLQMLETLQRIDGKLGAAPGAMGLDDIYDELTRIDLKLGAGPGAMGLDDIYHELTTIGSSLAVIEINTSG